MCFGHIHQYHSRLKLWPYESFGKPKVEVMLNAVFEFTFIDDLEHHSALVLVEPFGGFVDMVVVAGIRTSYYLQNFKTDPLCWKSGGALP